MHLADIFSVIQWWGYFFVIGLIFFPLVARFFDVFVDKGYLFAKVIGTVVIAYLVFVLGTAHIAPFTQFTIILVCFFCAIVVTFYLMKFPQKFSFSFPTIFLIVFEEILFLAGLFFWSFIRAHQPDIFGLEKYMDFGFVNSILASTYFPPRDMWYTPYPINYYYFGHLLTAVMTKLSNIPSYISFNLMLATLFSYAFSLSFSLAGNIWFLHRQKNTMSVSLRKILLQFLPAGILGGFLVTLGGNLHTIYTLFTPYQNDNPVPFWQLTFSPKTFPNNYWYPNATRFIYHTIHEFPSYSFVVSDLHGHVLDIPLVLTAVALLFLIIKRKQFVTPLKTKQKNAQQPFSLAEIFKYIQLHFSPIFTLIFIGFLLAGMYMTNAWDSMIYFLLTAVILFWQTKKIGKTISYLIFIFFWYLVFSLPFSLFFNPGELVGGIGLVCPPQLLIHIGKIGPFVFEANHCMRSPLWQLLILYGFFLFWLISFLFIAFRERKNLSDSDVFILILSFMAIFLVIIPEFFYLKDIYATYFRANTMFKLVYQAFILFSLSNAYMMFRFFHFFGKRSVSFWRKIALFPYFFLGVCFFALVAIYPYFGIMSYYNNLSDDKGLNGLTYLSTMYPTDADAINWIRKNIHGQPVMLEAQGDSYTSYARVSSNTGLPTVLGWTVHEWLWRGTYDIVPPRANDIAEMYTTTSPQVFRSLAKKYNVQYVFVGQLEQEKYPNVDEQKFNAVGKRIFHEGITSIYQVTASP